MPAIPLVMGIASVVAAGTATAGAILATSVTIAGVTVSTGSLIATAVVGVAIAVSIITVKIVKDKVEEKKQLLKKWSNMLAVAIQKDETTVITGIFHPDTEELTEVTKIEGDTIDSDLSRKFDINDGILTLENI